jgi:alginate O-acetyltransferase complex protein AlgI
MEFLSLPFISLLCIAFVAYYVGRGLLWQKMVLLLSSCIFIGYYHLLYLVVALAIAVFTFFAGHFIARHKETPTASYALLASITILVVAWLSFRYWSPLFPLGISFYTFQALSYLIEVYWDDEQKEDSLFDFVLYMLLFMKFLSGPIERGYDLLPQLKRRHEVDVHLISYGFKMLGLGIFMKIVIADRLAPYLDDVFASVHTASGIQLLEATLMYPIQLYTDFAGYTCMAIGIGMMFGFKLSPNFNRPFISQTTSELWRRWHISLSSWVRDYVFVPLTASVRSWNKWGVYVSLVVTFVVLGIWHGAGWTFVIYGLIQGIIIIYETATHKQHEYIKSRTNRHVFFVLSILRTYILFAFSLLFFRVEKMGDVWYMIGHVFDGIDKNWKEANLGMTDNDLFILGGSTFVLFLFEYIHSHKDLFDMVSHSRKMMKWSIYYVLLFLLFAFGCFGVENFIYIQF